MLKFDPEAKRFFSIFLILAIFAILPGMKVGYFISGVFVFLAGFSLYFLRDPERVFLGDGSFVISPADGEVIIAENYEDDEGQKYNRIAIFMNILDVHINRAPCKGEVSKLDYIKGGYKHAGSGAAFADNERMKIYLNTPRGIVQVHQIAGMVARRVVCRLEKGQNLERGDKIGVIRFGSRVELLLPASETEILAKKGDKVKCGVSPVAKWM